jgi:hypothetical protein
MHYDTKLRLLNHICGSIKEFFEYSHPDDIDPSAQFISRFMKDLAATGNFNTDDFTKSINAFSKAISAK